MNYSRHTPTEECPLTKDQKKFSVNNCCGFRGIICCFTALTAIITASLIFQLFYDENAFQGKLNVHGAVATDYINCSQIGTKILRRGGNAVDAAIAATVCMTVVAPHKTSLGSGGYLMIYDHKLQEPPIIIDFLNNTITDEFLKIKRRIPALLKGLEHAHKLFGKIIWKDLIKPAADIARNGFEITRDFAYEATKNKNVGIFGHISAGETLVIPNLADTLDTVAEFGTNAFYNGSISSKIFQSANLRQDLLQQMANYQPRIIQASKSKLQHFDIFYPPNLLHTKAVIQELNNLVFTDDKASLIESQISTAEKFLKVDSGNPSKNYTDIRRYAGVSVVDWQDIFVSVITGLSAPLDLTYKTEAGFFLDNADNSALSSLSPIIFYDDSVICGLRGVFGSDDALVTGQILYNLLLRGMNVSAAVEQPRYYLLSDGIAFENNEVHSVDTMLRARLVTIDSMSHVDANFIMKSVNVIIKWKNIISGHSDSRGDGLASRF